MNNVSCRIVRNALLVLAIFIIYCFYLYTVSTLRELNEKKYVDIKEEALIDNQDAMIRLDKETMKILADENRELKFKLLSTLQSNKLLSLKLKELELNITTLNLDFLQEEHNFIDYQSKIQAEHQIVEVGDSWTGTNISSSLAGQQHRPECSTIDIAIVCGGYNSTRSMTTLIKSILFYRKNPIHLHILVDQIAHSILTVLFTTWKVPSLTVSYYNMTHYEHEVSWIPNYHYSRLYGLMKLLLPSILPESVKRLIVLDTDLVVAADIYELYKHFDAMDHSTITDDMGNTIKDQSNTKRSIGLVENQSDWYLSRTRKNDNTWPALGRGFNTGVILFNLEQLRVLKWSELWRVVAETELTSLLATTLADQDIVNAVLRNNPYLVYMLPCQWNVQLSENSLIDKLCNTDINLVKIIHWNSPVKFTSSNNKYMDYFENFHLSFLEYDGKLLQRQLIGCNNTRKYSKLDQHESLNLNEHSFSPIEALENNHFCKEFQRSSAITYRTHLYYLDFEYSPKDEFDVTLVVQLSMDRLQMLEQLCSLWPGPISLALYLSDMESYQFLQFAQESEILSKRKNIGYHIVYRDGFIYPINKLRNIALKHLTTSYVFLTDIDFLPANELYDNIRSTLSTLKNGDLSQVIDLGPSPGKDTFNKSVFVIPAFENQRYKMELPETKAELMTQLNMGNFFTFRHQLWPRGHAPTNYEIWRVSTKPYRVHWKPEYEPYIVAPKDIPPYDERFVGFGWNKVSHTMILAAKQYYFIVLPNAFIIHMPHAPSYDIVRHRSLPNYRKCIRKLKNKFLAEMQAEYPDFFANYSGMSANA